jgi:hypothetical protein
MWLAVFPMKPDLRAVAANSPFGLHAAVRRVWHEWRVWADPADLMHLGAQLCKGCHRRNGD